MLGTKEIKTRALLIHCNTALQNLDITAHEVMQIPSAEGFTLGAGRAFSQHDKEQLVQILQDEEGDRIDYIPDTLLVKSRSIIVWYRKPEIHELKFKTDSDSATVKAPIPGLIFIAAANRSLRCYAYKGNGRPTPETKLYFTPLPNMYRSGSFCSGNVQVPTIIATSNIPDWEGFVLDSANTHIGGLATIKGCDQMEQYIEHYQTLESKGKKTFPSHCLVPVSNSRGHLTLDQAVRGEQ